MKLSDADLLKLLPAFMRVDETSVGLSKGVSEFAHIISHLSPVIRKWDQIDNMTDAELDEIAWELDIGWYHKSASIDVKRQIVKDSDMVHAHRGTKWAVEQVASTYFGESRIEEWFEYGGRPYFFKISTRIGPLEEKTIAMLVNAIQSVKNTRSWLEFVELVQDMLSTVYIGGSASTNTHSQHALDYRNDRALTASISVLGISSFMSTTRIRGIDNYG